MSVLAVTALLLAAIIGTVLIFLINERAVRTGVNTINRLRWAFGLAFLALAAWHLLQSGNALYTLLAILGFAFLTGYFLIEKPWRKTI